MSEKTKRVLVQSGGVSPWLSEAAIRRLREIGWKSAFHPDQLSETDQDHQGGMILKGEADWEGGINELESSGGCLSGYCRHDPLLLRVFDELGQAMFLTWTSDTVHILEIPDDVDYVIGGSDMGPEHIREKSRTWHIQRSEADT